MGNEVKNKTLGMIGFGAIGSEVANRAIALGMDVLVFDPMVDEAPEGMTKATLEEVYAGSDYITIHAPKNKFTTNLINKETIAKCKKGFKILNVARGGIINEHDILESLDDGHCSGAAFDVFSIEPPTEDIMRLIRHPNVICTPHLGASTEEA